MANEHEGATTELLQTMIRNECVNDGTPDSGGEVRNAELLQQYLEGPGVDIEQFSSRPGRTSTVGCGGAGRSTCSTSRRRWRSRSVRWPAPAGARRAR